MMNPVVGTPGVTGLLLVKPAEDPTDSESDPAGVELLRVRQIDAVLARKRTNKW